MAKRNVKKSRTPRGNSSSRSGQSRSSGSLSSPSSKPWEAVKRRDGTGSDPSDLCARFVASISVDWRLYKYDIAGSLAHARMLVDQGLIESTDYRRIERGLKHIEHEIDKAGDGWPGWKVELEDVHMCIEAALIEQIGDAALKLHTGRSRNDQVALDLKLWIVDAIGHLQRQFDRLFRAFVNLAERDGEIVIVSYTHLQRAQPIVVGAELLAWVSALDRCRDRLLALKSVNQGNPLGSGAIAGSALPLDRKHTAMALGIGDPMANSIDATANRDAAVDFVYGLAMVAMTMSRWAEQWIIYASAEFDYIELGVPHTTGSSMMPQKRNPDMLELIRGRTGTVYGHLVALLTLCKGITIGYNRDLQEDKRHLFGAYDCIVDGMAMAAEIVESVRFDRGKIEAKLEFGFPDATSLAEYLVTQSVPFRTAHQIVGTLVRHCEETGITQLSKLSLVELNNVCQRFGFAPTCCGRDVYDWLGPTNVVRRYRTAGNAGLSGFRRQLTRWRRKLKR